MAVGPREDTAHAQVHAGIAALEKARRAAERGDPQSVLRELRELPDEAAVQDPRLLADAAALVADVAARLGADELQRAAAAVSADHRDAHVLYTYGYACVERGVAFLGVPALMLALARHPDAPGIRFELVSALEAESRHGDAVRALSSQAVLEQWIGRYLIVFNSLMAGDVEGARQWFSRLGKPEDDGQRTMEARLRGMLTRVQLVTGSSRLDDPHTPASAETQLGRRDLRGWHFALNGTVLTTLSPYGWDGGMNGRYAYLADSGAVCRWGLHRLGVVLEAAARRPVVVAPLLDRSSTILGLAAARVLGLPARPYASDLRGALVVAYTLGGQPPALLDALRRAPEQMLFEHASCWTEPPPLAADVVTLVHQRVFAPWEARAAVGAGIPARPADDRPAEQVAADLAAHPVGPSVGDGHGPRDPDEALRAFVTRVAARWAPGVPPRDRPWSPAAVQSARFA